MNAEPAGLTMSDCLIEGRPHVAISETNANPIFTSQRVSHLSKVASMKHEVSRKLSAATKACNGLMHTLCGCRRHNSECTDGMVHGDRTCSL